MQTEFFQASSGSVLRRPRERWREHLQRLDSLKLRVGCGALIALFAGIALALAQMGHLAEQQVVQRSQDRELIEGQQLAAIVGRRVAELQRSLSVTGERLRRTQLDDSAGLARFLEAQPALRMQFANVFVADRLGHVRVVHEPAGAKFPGISIAGRSYFQRAVESRMGVVSEPFEGRISKLPIVMMVQPLIDEHGVWGVIGGALQLANRDFVESLAEATDFEGASMVVVTDDFGRIIAHPQTAMLLKSITEEPRLAVPAARWLAEGKPLVRDSATWSTADDVVAMAGDATTRWHIWRLVPKAELLAPLDLARRSALRTALFTAAFMALALGGFLAWQLRPLGLLERRARGLMEGDADGPWPSARGELGQLMRTLRHVWIERRQAELFNAEVTRRLQSVMRASPIGLTFTRHQRFELVSAEFCRMLGYESEQLDGAPARMIYASAADYESIGTAVGAAFAAGQAYCGDWQLQRRDGSRLWARLHCSPVEAGQPAAGTIWSVYDVTDQLAAARDLEHAALHDMLTGALNRKGFAAELDAALALPTEVPASVLMIDLDRFKAINDSAGHAAGDAVLRNVVDVIRSCIRSADRLGRLGGDEFAVLLPGCDGLHADAVARKICHAVTSAKVRWADTDLSVGASLGVAERAARHLDAAQWLAEADAQCYEVKRAGRGSVGVSRPRLAVADS